MLSRPRSLFCLFVLLPLLIAPCSVFAQSQANTGTIEGTVTDPSGSSVPKAGVTLKNVGTNFTRVIQTDAEGRFRGLLLPLGPYTVTATAPNFGTSVREGLDLAVGQTISLAITLKVSQVNEVISVTGDAPI